MTKKEEIIEIGKISSRGQIAIPSEIRKRLELEEGKKVIFILDGDTLIMKKLTSKTFSHLIKK